jgi:Flp pilus assembly protein TadD
MSGRRKLLVAGLLVALPLLTYVPSLSNGTIWDDDAYVTENRNLRSVEGLARIWTDPRATPQYYPLVHTSYWLEHRLWGVEPAGYHLVNVLLHATSVLVLWGLLRRLGLPGATLAAALFAVHPVQVETVAWITERKNTLSGLFYLCSAAAWLRFRPPEDERAGGGAGAWLASFLCFAGALLSKSVTATLPAALLVVTWWKRGRIGWRRDVLPLLPFFALGIALGLHTAWLERTHVGAAGPAWDLSFVERTLIAGRALWFYAAKLVWPHPLIFVYPRWSIDAGDPRQHLFPLAAVLLVGVLWALRGRIGRGPLAAALFFGGSLLPASGYFDVYPMRFSFVADHFQYLPSLGPLALLAAGLARACRAPPAPCRALGAALVLVLAALAWRQQGDYADARTLWTRTAEKNPECWIAQDSLGLFARADGDLPRALGHFRRATELDPLESRSFDSLGSTLLLAGEPGAAIEAFGRAIELRPDLTAARVNLAAALAELGHVDEAAAQLEEVLRLEPDNALALANLGRLELHRGNRERARQLAEQALAVAPDYLPALRLLQEAGG